MMDRLREADPTAGRDQRMREFHNLRSVRASSGNPLPANSVGHHCVAIMAGGSSLPNCIAKTQPEAAKLSARATRRADNCFLLVYGPVRKEKSHILPAWLHLTFPCISFRWLK